MSKKRCFICDTSINSMMARCVTKDGFLVCGNDAKKVMPKYQAGKYRISLKTYKYINNLTTTDIENLLNIGNSLPYKEKPDLYMASKNKVSQKLNSIADSANKKAIELQTALDEIDKKNQSKLNIIQQQLNTAGVENLFGVKKEIKALANLIDFENNEKILYAANAFVETKSILAVCTNKRVIFLEHGLIYGNGTTNIPLDTVNGVSYSKGLMLSSIAVTNGAVTTQIDNMQPYPAERLADTIKQAAAEFKKIPAQSTSDNTFSQLRELKQLLDDGIINKEEFDAKKKQILGI